MQRYVIEFVVFRDDSGSRDLALQIRQALCIEIAFREPGALNRTEGYFASFRRPSRGLRETVFDGIHHTDTGDQQSRADRYGENHQKEPPLFL